MLPTEKHSPWPERYCPGLECKHSLLSVAAQIWTHGPSSSRPRTLSSPSLFSCPPLYIHLSSRPGVFFPSLHLSLPPLFRPLSLHISFTLVQRPAVGTARVAAKWRNGPQIAPCTVIGAECLMRVYIEWMWGRLNKPWSLLLWLHVKQRSFIKPALQSVVELLMHLSTI